MDTVCAVWQFAHSSTKQPFQTYFEMRGHPRICTGGLNSYLTAASILLATDHGLLSSALACFVIQSSLLFQNASKIASATSISSACAQSSVVKNPP